MEVTTLTTSGDNTLLTGLRAALDDAETALLCVAFVQSPGVNLLRPQLETLGKSARLLLTTVFTENSAALSMAHRLGTDLAILNPAGGTYHPKVYATRRGRDATVVIGSSNLTGGLVNNVEAAVMMQGRWDDRPIMTAWTFAEALWSDPRRRPWTPTGVAVEDEAFEQPLYALVAVAVDATKGEFETLGPRPKVNRVTQVIRTGLYVETDATKAKRAPPQLIPAWMFTLAWDYLRTHGSLSNRYLLASSGLNVKRSSAVCAILARLPGVRVEPGPGIVLAWDAARILS